jgi:class 3 adenylate cyclase
MPEPCESCRHYEPAPANRPDVDPQCHRGVHFGRAIVSAVSVRTMRDDHWWGRDGCQQEGRFWEARK